jgi:hypothetical protein
MVESVPELSSLPPQEESVSQPLDIDIQDVQSTLHLANLFNTPVVEDKKLVRDWILKVIEGLKSKIITIDTVQELVVLMKTNDKEIFKNILNQFIKVGKDNPILQVPVVHGLAALFYSASEKVDLEDDHGFFTVILEFLYSQLKKSSWTEENGEELLPLLRALSELFKAMLCKGIKGIDCVKIYLPLKEELENLSQFKNPEKSFLANYACQSLAYIGNNESLGVTVLRYCMLAIEIATDLKDAVVNFDPTKLLSVYEKIVSMNDQIYKLEWCKSLMFADCLLGREDLLNFERFILRKQSDKKFMQRICLCLEKVAEIYRCDQHDIKVSNGAIRMLKGIVTYHTGRVQEIAQISLSRLSIDSEGIFYFFSFLFFFF